MKTRGKLHVSVTLMNTQMQSKQRGKHCAKFAQEENRISHVCEQLTSNLQNPRLKISTQENHENAYFLSSIRIL